MGATVVNNTGELTRGRGSRSLTFHVCTAGHSALKNRPVRLRGVRAPLFTRRSKKNGSPFCGQLTLNPNSHNRTTETATHLSDNSPTSPLHMYISENFAVRLHQCFKLRKLLHDAEEYGVICTEFDRFRQLEKMKLTESAQKILNVPNAGGNSVVSEVLSFELLAKCFGAHLLKTEMEVTYFPEGGSITDYVVNMYEMTLGVSVTRAMNFRAPLTVEDAERLLNKKLNGVIQSSKNSLDKWCKQILHVWVLSMEAAHVVIQAYENVAAMTKSNTVVIVTVAANAPEVFFNQ